MTQDRSWFADARYGLFVHYGLYSLLGRGEWALNREALDHGEYRRLMERFNAEKFDADSLIRRARDWGMRYAILTTKHHEGFCLYDSALTDFKAPRSRCGRDLVAEFVQACRKHGLKAGLYHSLNDWLATPNATDALERPSECYQPFIDYVHGQIRDLVTKYAPLDILWYDGWWPFDGAGWQGDKLNAMVRELQPGILLNGRCGRPGDFATPEGHLASSTGMWEACMPTNQHWGFHKGDRDWKPPKEICGMLQRVAAGGGNLLLNVGPAGDGSIPAPCGALLDQVGEWLKVNGEAIYDSDRFEIDPHKRGDARGDWSHYGAYTARGNNFYLHVTTWPGTELRIAGVECSVREVKLLKTGQTFDFTQERDLLTVRGLPAECDTSLPPVLRFATKDSPRLYMTGGSRTPSVPHPRYDPVVSDILY